MKCSTREITVSTSTSPLLGFFLRHNTVLTMVKKVYECFNDDLFCLWLPPLCLLHYLSLSVFGAWIFVVILWCYLHFYIAVAFIICLYNTNYSLWFAEYLFFLNLVAAFMHTVPAILTKLIQTHCNKCWSKVLPTILHIMWHYQLTKKCMS